MNYLLMTNDFHPNKSGRMANYYTDIADAFDNDSLYVVTPAPENEIQRDVGCKVFRMDIKLKYVNNFINKRRVYKKVIDLVKQYNINVILCGNFRPYSEIACKVSKKFKVPYYIFFHGNDIIRSSKRMQKYLLKKIQYGYVLNNSRGFITNSNYVMDLIPARYKKDKSLLVLNPGVSKTFENLEIKKPFDNPDVFRFLTVGRLAKRKGVDTVIKCLSLLRKNDYKVHYDVIGRGGQEFFENTAKKYNVDDMVTFHGFVSQDELMNFYSDMDAFLMISNFTENSIELEGFGIVYLEANAFGKPVIASYSGGIPDAVEDNKSGLLVKDPFNVEELFQKIKYLCDNKDKSQEMGLYGYNRVNSRFKYSDVVCRLTESIENDLNQSC